MSELQAFREEVRGWLGEHCPEGARGEGDIHLGTTKKTYDRDLDAWLEIMAERGWTVPMWPTEYGGGGLSLEQTKVLYEEMSAIDARPPLRNMGTRMLVQRQFE